MGRPNPILLEQPNVYLSLTNENTTTTVAPIIDVDYFVIPESGVSCASIISQNTFQNTTQIVPAGWRKISDINVSSDNCGPYKFIVSGTFSEYFAVYNSALYVDSVVFSLPTRTYTITVSIVDIANRFTPISRNYSISITQCLTTTTIPGATTTTTAPGTTTTTTSGPFVYPSNIVSTNAIYSQSSVWGQNLPATASTMNNRTHLEVFETGTNVGLPEWVMMDLRSVFNVKNIVIGCDFDNVLTSGWGKYYTEDLSIQSSIDGVNWTTIGNTGLFTEPMKNFPVNINARYIRITNSNRGSTYIGVTEFAAGI